MNLKALSNLLASRKLIFDKKIANFQYKRNKYRFVLIVKDIHEKKFIFKGLINENDQSKKNFSKEIRIIKKFSGQETPFKTNSIVAVGEKPSLWLISNFIEGEVAGNIFEYQQSKMNPEIITLMQSSVEWLHKNPPDFITKNDQIFIQWLNKNLEGTSKDQDLISCQKKINQIADYLRRYGSNNKNLVFSHNDLTPINTIINRKEVYLIDWELSGYNLAPFDLACFYQRFWQYPNSQEQIYDSSVSQKDPSFKKTFLGLNIIFLCIDLVTFKKTLKGFQFKHLQKFPKDYIKKLNILYKEKLQVLLRNFNK